MIKKRLRIITEATADGQSSSFGLNLMNDVHWIDTSSVTGLLQNWANNTPTNTKPTDVDVIEGASSASIDADGAIVTIGVPVQPGGFVYKVVLDLLF
jgi:hypothetical protein